MNFVYHTLGRPNVKASSWKFPRTRTGLEHGHVTGIQRKSRRSQIKKVWPSFCDHMELGPTSDNMPVHMTQMIGLVGCGWIFGVCPAVMRRQTYSGQTLFQPIITKFHFCPDRPHEHMWSSDGLCVKQTWSTSLRCNVLQHWHVIRRNLRWDAIPVGSHHSHPDHYHLSHSDPGTVFLRPFLTLIPIAAKERQRRDKRAQRWLASMHSQLQCAFLPCPSTQCTLTAPRAMDVWPWAGNPRFSLKFFSKSAANSGLYCCYYQQIFSIGRQTQIKY